MPNEMTKLAILLAKADIPFELVAFVIGGNATLQIACPNKKDCVADAVCHEYSYGGKDGLIEVLSEFEEDVVGWLTAEEAFGYFEKAVGKDGGS